MGTDNYERETNRMGLKTGCSSFATNKARESEPQQQRGSNRLLHSRAQVERQIEVFVLGLEL